MSSVRERLKKQAEKVGRKIQEEQKRMKAIQQKINAQERRQRTRELIELGGLAEIAGFRGFDKGALLGVLLQGREMLKDEATYKNLKQLGDSTLQSRASKRRENSKRTRQA